MSFEKKYQTTVVVIDAETGEILKNTKNMVTVNQSIRYITRKNSATTIKEITKFVKKNNYIQGKLF